MTGFGPDLDNVMTAFPSVDLEHTLTMELLNKRQLYISESEKYAHVTYFINGGYADPVAGEIRVKVDSPTVVSYGKRPEMAAKGVSNEVIKHIEEGSVDFYCVNFANPDMVGHTGNFTATKKAVKVVDGEIDKIIKLILSKKGQALIISDHGNAEEMLNNKTGEIMTEHTIYPVPCILVKDNTRGIKLKDGILADVAPTLLKMMEVKKPKEMTGRALF